MKYRNCKYRKNCEGRGGEEGGGGGVGGIIERTPDARKV